MPFRTGSARHDSGVRWRLRCSTTAGPSSDSSRIADRESTAGRWRVRSSAAAGGRRDDGAEVDVLPALGERLYSEAVFSTSKQSTVSLALLVLLTIPTSVLAQAQPPG